MTITTTAIVLRVTIAVFTSTFFQPDEYFQSLEPAHRLVFGYGALTWEWKVSPPIRSIFFPGLYTPVYWLLRVLGLGDTILLILLPKVLQGLFAAITDISVYRLARRTIGERYAFMASLLSFCSIFHLQALSRTLSNSVETSLTTLALSYWPLASLETFQNWWLPLLSAALACMVRPTNAIIWAFVFLETSWCLRCKSAVLLRLLFHTLLVAFCACTSLFFLDSWYFGEYTFTPLNFLVTNLSPVSSFYGRNPWHYYLTQGIPILCDFSTPWFIRGAWRTLLSGTPPVRLLLRITLWTLLVYSLAAHKEWRFIHPLLPIMHVLSAKAIVDTWGKNVTIQNIRQVPILWRRICLLMAITLTPYLLFVQSRAQVAVIYHLRSIPPSDLRSVGFLMPCHSTPWQSYLHRDNLTEKSMWAIGCEPPIGGQSIDSYQDQSDVFYDSPLGYLETWFPKEVDPSFPPSPSPITIPGDKDPQMRWEHAWPSHLVFFGAFLEVDGMELLLQKLGYQEEWRGWNGWEQDSRRRGGIKVWGWRNPSETV